MIIRTNSAKGKLGKRRGKRSHQSSRRYSEVPASQHFKTSAKSASERAVYRLDPTRTATLRRAFATALTKPYARIKAKVIDLLVKEDAFGIQRRADLGGSNILVSVNTRWATLTPAQQLARFQEWLRLTIAAETEEAAAAALEREIEQYIRQGLARGAGRSFDDVRKNDKLREQLDQQRQSTQAGTATRGIPGQGGRLSQPLPFYQGNREQFLRSAFNQPVAKEKLQLLITRAYTDIKGVNEQMATVMGRVLTDGLVEGKSPLEIARDLNAEIDSIGINRARTIARTELIRAHAEGQLIALEQLGVKEVGVMVEWSTTGDDKVCPKCQPMEGAVLTIEEARGLIPRHPNCLLGDTLVLPGSEITATSERFYDGDVVVFRTSTGRELTCTPNHPILTDRGFFPAKNLYQGCNVVCDGRGQWIGLVDHQDQNVPTMIKEIADSFRGSINVSSSEVPTSSPDFHGDGMDSDVAIIRTYCELGNPVDPSLREHPQKGSFKVRDIVGLSLVSGSHPGAKVNTVLHSSDCIVGSPDLSPPVLLGHIRPLEDFSFTPPPRVDTGLKEAISDRLPTDSILEGNGIFRHPPEVVGNYILSGQGWIGEPADGTVFTSEDSHYHFDSYSELASKISNGSAGPVFLDEVVSLVVKQFTGHVYNLETKDGWYASNGIITHNCRCAWTPANVGEGEDEDQVRSAADLRRAVEESGEDDSWEVSIEDERPEAVINRFSELLHGGEPADNASFFATCERNEKGWCELGGSGSKESARAKFIGARVGRAEHIRAAEIENTVADMVGGDVQQDTDDKGQRDKKPYDVRVGNNVIEVKSMLKGGKTSISVHDDALIRKIDHARDTGNVFHTVVWDDRDSYEGGEHADKHSGHTLYYKRGSGRYSLSKMEPVEDGDHLRRLLEMSNRELPERARGSLPPPPPVRIIRERARRAYQARSRRDRVRKARLREERLATV